MPTLQLKSLNDQIQCIDEHRLCLQHEWIALTKIVPTTSQETCAIRNATANLRIALNLLEGTCKNLETIGG